MRRDVGYAALRRLDLTALPRVVGWLAICHGVRCLQRSHLSRSALVKFVADADFDVAAERVRDRAELGRLLDAAP